MSDKNMKTILNEWRDYKKLVENKDMQEGFLGFKSKEEKVMEALKTYYSMDNITNWIKPLCSALNAGGLFELAIRIDPVNGGNGDPPISIGLKDGKNFTDYRNNPQIVSLAKRTLENFAPGGQIQMENFFQHGGVLGHLYDSITNQRHGNTNPPNYNSVLTKIVGDDVKKVEDIHKQVLTPILKDFFQRALYKDTQGAAALLGEI